MAAVIVYNSACTRKLYTMELDKKKEDVWFTSCAKAYLKETGEEFLAVGTSSGVIYKVTVQANGA